MKNFLLTIVGLSHLFISAQNWQLKCQYNFSQTYGSLNHYYDFDPGNEQKGAIINNNNALRLTTDGGQSWSNETQQSGMEAIKYIAPNTLIYTGYKKIYKSINGGQTFTQVTNSAPDESPFSIDYFGNFIVMGNYACRVTYSTDGGATWTNKKIHTSAQPLRTVRVLSPTFAYAIAQSNVFYTTDAGNTWISLNQLNGVTINGSPVTFPISTLYQYLSFTAKDENNWLVSFKFDNQQYLFKTSNAGSSWSEVTSLLPKVSGSKPVELSSLFATPDGQVFATIPNGINLYNQTFATNAFVYDSVDASITLDERFFKTIHNKVYLLVKFSLSGSTAYRIYTRNFNNSTHLQDLHSDN
ncbi:MAG: hypothetical protein NZ522_09780, partial [Chitinophagales bacterium]|nr:hypothetical protein [Chitinophagales bacterium]